MSENDGLDDTEQEISPSSRRQDPEWPPPPPGLRWIEPDSSGGVNIEAASEASGGQPPLHPTATLSAPRDGHSTRGWTIAGLVLIVASAAAGIGLFFKSNLSNSSAPILPGQAADTVSTAGKLGAGVVDINTKLAYQGVRGAGTGVVISSSGEVLTNNHVVAGATSIEVTDVETGRTYSAIVVGYDVTDDIAVLHLEGARKLKTVSIGDSSKVAVGDPVTAIGNALGAGGAPTVTTGSVTALDQSITTQSEDGSVEQMGGLIQVDAPLQPGDSGGPLVDANGEVVGINTAASRRFSFRRRQAEPPKGYAIPINQALSIARQIEDGKASTTVHIGATGFLGVHLAASNAQSGAGVVVAAVEQGSPAESVGLAEGDMIESIDTQSVDSPAALHTLLQSHRPGDSVRLGWLNRFGQRQAATVTLADGPPG